MIGGFAEPPVPATQRCCQSVYNSAGSTGEDALQTGTGEYAPDLKTQKAWVGRDRQVSEIHFVFTAGDGETPLRIARWIGGLRSPARLSVWSKRQTRICSGTHQ